MVTRRDYSHLEELKYADPNAYQDVLRVLVDAELDLLTPRQKVTARGEVFEDAETGDLVSAMQLSKSMAGMDVLPQSGVHLGYRNAATPRQMGKGVYKSDIGVNVPAASVGETPMLVKSVDRWAGDSAAAAFVDPEGLDLSTASKKDIQAALMGLAASTGDGARIIDANRRYDISDEFVDEFLDYAKRGNSSLGSVLKNAGLIVKGQDRPNDVVAIASGNRVVDLSPEEQQAFYNQRIHDLTKVWLQGGGRALNDFQDDVSVPSNYYNMEHNVPFAIGNSSGFAESSPNRVGFLESLVNSEKGEIPPEDYYKMQQLAYLARKSGINIKGVKKSNDIESNLKNMLTIANPESRRNKKISGAKEANDELFSKVIAYPTSRMVEDERKLTSDEFIINTPVRRMAGTRPEMVEIASGRRTDSPGDSKERALYINSGGGDVAIGQDVLRSNGNGKHKNGNRH